MRFKLRSPRSSLLLCSREEIMTWLFRHSHFWNGRYLTGINVIGSKCNNVLSYDKGTSSKVPLITAEPAPGLSHPSLCPRATTASLAVQMLILPTRRAGLGQAASLFCVRMWEGYGDTTLFNNDGSQQLALSEGLYKNSFRHHNSLAKQGLLISPFYRWGGKTCLSPNPWTRGGGSRVTKVNHLETSGMGWSRRIESKTGCGSGRQWTPAACTWISRL